MELFLSVLNALGDAATVIGTVWVIGIWWANRKRIGAALSALSRYGLHLTAIDLASKLHELNRFNADVASQRREALNVLADLVGQVEGNPDLKQSCRGILRDMRGYLENPEEFAEWKKRIIVAKLKEKLRVEGTRMVSDEGETE